MSNHQSSIAKAVRAGRAVLGWSQQDLSRLSKLSLPTIARLESGVSAPRYDTIRQILDLYQSAGVSIELLSNDRLAINFDPADSAQMTSKLDDSSQLGRNLKPLDGLRPVAKPG